MIRKRTTNDTDSAIMQNSTPLKMLIACFFSCILGIVLMLAISNYLLTGVFAAVLICIAITTPLCSAGKISLSAACLAPMLLLCFVYTPLSWFAFDGLMGCTPYISILLITVIVLTYYRGIQMLILSLYAVLLTGLTIHWLITWSGEHELNNIINILVAYILTVSLIVFIVESVKRKNNEINKRITDLSLRDELTGLFNRRAIEPVLKRIESVSSTDKSEYAVVMLDVDRFKSINDLYGHNSGDSVLKSLAACIQKSIRSADYAFRYGGDEFLLLLTNVDQATASLISERIEMALCEVHGYDFPITVSIGCALRSESSSTAAVLELADQRMYKAKRKQSQTEYAAVN